MVNKFLILAAFCISAVISQAQTTRNAATSTDLSNAITASVDNDIINITGNIVVGAQLNNSKTITINGNGFTITVTNPGLDDAGRFNASASTFRTLGLTGSGKTTTINNLTIKGGLLSSNGGAISVGSGHILKLNYCVISNSRTSVGGGGIANSGGVVYLNNCQVLRNAGNYGGGFLNSSGGKIYVEFSTFSENRSTSSSGGGGAGENNGSTSSLYINNSTFSNNKSTEIGGAINNYAGSVYALNSSFTGNVAYGTYQGGAIGNNSGYVWAINCLFAYNYRRTGGSVTNPTLYVLDDLDAYSSPANVRLYYCILHSTLLTGITKVIGNVNYTGALNGSDNTIFSGGSLSKITDGTGFEIGTASVFQPFLYNNTGGIAPTLKSGSFTLQSGNRGTPTRYSNDNNVAPKLAYYDRTASSWVSLLSAPTASHDVTTDQVGVTRTNPPAIGAIEGTVDNLYMLKVNASADGSVNGGSIYGDVYPSGTSVTLTAIPNASRQFQRWDYVLGGTGTASTSNPYTLILDKDITLIPIFQTVTAGNYSVTYAGNGNTGGDAPTAGNFSASTPILSKNTLKKSGYLFVNWNTNSNGSGTGYAAGDTYNAGANLILYAQWTQNFWKGSVSSSFASAGNWLGSSVPGADDDVVFANDAVNDLVLDQDRQVGDVKFSSANVKMTLGNFQLTASNVTGYGSQRYIQTNGTGKLKLNIPNGSQKIFPVGRSAYNPVAILNNTGSADNFSVLTLDEVYANGTGGSALASARVKRTWDISKTTANAGSGVDFLFNWNSGEAVNVTVPALYRYASAAWQKQTGSVSSTATSLTYTGYTGVFTQFAVGDNSMSLPLTWQDFTLSKQGDGVLLNWSTAIEQNTSDFLVEHIGNNGMWEVIGTVAAANNSITEQHYQYFHSSPPNGLNLYRIRQRDLDGKSSFSKVLSISINNSNRLLVYPNPVTTGQLTIQLQQAEEVSLYSGDGKLVLHRQMPAGSHKLALQGLSKGLYRLKAGKETVNISIQ